MYGLPGKDSVVVLEWENMFNPVNFMVQDKKNQANLPTNKTVMQTHFQERAD